MAKMTLEDLRKLRESKKKELSRRDTEGKDINVIIGMGTCGIAAGAKEALDAFIDELEKQNLSNVAVKQTGCMGLCHVEPTVEVVTSDMPATIYGNVDAETARLIVKQHIMGKAMVSDHIYDRPSVDIVKNGEA